MVNGNQIITKLIVAGLLLLFAGCGGKGEKVEIPEIGFSMKLPAGWTTSADTVKIFYGPTRRTDHWGGVLVFPLKLETDTFGGKRKILNDNPTLSEYVEFYSKKFRVREERMVSKTTRMIDGLEAIEVVTERPWTISLYYYIRKGDKVIEVWFHTPKETFPRDEPFLRGAIESIKIK